MKVKCISEIAYFTKDKVYDVVDIDNDGDIWVEDDQGDAFFMFPDECEVVEE